MVPEARRNGNPPFGSFACPGGTFSEAKLRRERVPAAVLCQPRSPEGSEPTQRACLLLAGVKSPPVGGRQASGLHLRPDKHAGASDKTLCPHTVYIAPVFLPWAQGTRRPT